MDRNSIFGIVIIFGIFIGYFWLTKPTKEEIEAQKRQNDSIALVQQKAQEEAIKAKALGIKGDTTSISASKSSNHQIIKSSNSSDTSAKVPDKNKLGSFYKTATGTDKFYTIENELLKIKILNKGGRISYVQLKQYKTYDGKPLILFDENTSKQNFTFFAENRDISTSNLFFKPYWANASYANKENMNVSGNDSISLSMRLYPVNNDSLTKKDKYIEYVYTLKGNSYIVNYKVNFVGVNDMMTSNSDFINLSWNCDLLRQEKSLTNERSSSTIYYKFSQDEVDFMSETKDEKLSLKTKIKWISFKQQFFTSVLIADNNFLNAELQTKTDATSEKFLKTTSADISVPFIVSDRYSIPMKFYFGPTKYKILRKYDLDLERQIPLGWSFFLLAWINKYAVLPVFNFLEGFNINYGIIILILTILLKIVLFPIAYKTYISSAKMRLLKPEIDEITKKFPKKEDALKKQQATMAMYKKAGVSPLSGCVPMLLQFPILIALFRFFPASIELRQQGFLWADDLSSYDSVLSLPFTIPFYGDHVSLFTILMTISTIAYTYINNQMMTTSTQQMPGMKTMMYIMPVMFLGIFNNYSSGLSYYYLLANLLTFAQIYTIKGFVNEDKLHKQIQENKKKPEGKKSNWQKRLEDMAKQRGYNPNQGKKK